MASEGGKGRRGDRLGKENREKWISRQWRQAICGFFAISSSPTDSPE